MSDISSFPTMHDVLVAGDNIQTFTAGAAITAGQVVAFHGTGVSKTVHPAVKGTTVVPVGVALYDASSGDKVAVACRGCHVKVANYDDTTAIDAGDPLEDNDNAVGGTVGTLPISASGATATLHYRAGWALEDIAGGGTGIMEVDPGITIQPNAS